MSNIPPYQMNTPPHMQPKKPGVPVWVWIIVAVGGTCLCCPVLAAIIFPVIAQSRNVGMNSESVKNARFVSTAMQMYMADNDEIFPTFNQGFRPSVALHNYTKNDAIDAVADRYEWNGELSGLKQSSIGNAVGLFMFMSDEPPTSKRVTIGFADFHVRSTDRSLLKLVRMVNPSVKGGRN